MANEPPSYTFDFPIPDYSSEPRADEERLEYQQGRSWPPNYDVQRPTGIFVHQQDGVTVILNYQEDKATVPVFGRRANIEGSLIIDAPESVTEVTLKISGSIEAVAPTAGWEIVKCLDQTHTIFKADSQGTGRASPESSLSSGSGAPSSIPFSCSLPSTFKYNGCEYLLPPSYYILLPGQQGQAYYVKCTYSFTALISKNRSRRTAFLPGKNRKTNTFPFEYCPRVRPPRPVIDRSLLSTIKISPEEWRKFSYQISPKSDKHHIEPLTCQFFLPSVGVFGIMDSIPFHIQILGSRASLSKLQTASDSSHNDKPLIRVHLARQVVMENNRRKSAVHFPLGEAKLCSLPPVEGALTLTPDGNGRSQSQENLNWEGEIRCQLEDKLTPSFNAGMVNIMDFVIIELSKWHTHLFQPFKHGHPVRLVSDSWRDNSR
ncbi:hypothetical protein GYMLUDRAFT_35410 [Collybiopsis luxurians FD-317 M1]|nr:hypothetical protein GYMLUDRAFT_35410 [Collybiopsis luxurians FD-317 M1]